jgi:GTPase SAR1 family protein
MSDELKVSPIPSENKPIDPRFEKLKVKNLPKLPTNCLLLGSVGSGKSSCLYSLLTEGYVYGPKKKSVFDEMVVYLGNMESVYVFEQVKVKNKLIMNEFDSEAFNQYLEDLKAHQMERLEKGKPPLNICLIYDDMAAVSLLKKDKGAKYSPLERLVLTSRHEANCSLFFCSQVLKSGGFSTPTVRNNIMTYIIYYLSRPEAMKAAEELCQQYTPQEFMEIYYKILETPYNFMTIDTRRPLGQRIWERFSHPVVHPKQIKDDEKKKEEPK